MKDWPPVPLSFGAPSSLGFSAPAWNSSDALVAAATASFRFCFAFRLSGDAAVEQTPPVAVTTVSD